MLLFMAGKTARVRNTVFYVSKGLGSWDFLCTDDKTTSAMFYAVILCG